MKRILTISQIMVMFGVFVVIFILTLIGYVYFTRELTIRGLPDYYQTLARACYDKQNPNCCLNSVRTMAENGYGIISQNSCWSGFQKNNLSCPDSYSWCEPASK